jgi:CubicO group peptidase (beta-lactamase class C family)
MNAKNSQFLNNLEKHISRLMKEAEVPGLSIAIVRNGEVFWHKGFGVKNAEAKQPVADDTVFEAASLSKTVFAYAVLKMVESGKIDLDVPLSKYHPVAYIETPNKIYESRV